jgi:glycosyltransferase involved in cell wall biosynthesis
VLAGDGPEDTRLRALASELGVADACHFLGRHRSPHALSRLADVSVSASSEEGMSNSLIEAQMMGLPVVACLETAGNAEIVRDGVNGYLYPFGDQERFQACIAALYDGAALLARMREASRRIFLERFTMAAQVQGYRQLYRRILGRGS